MRSSGVKIVIPLSMVTLTLTLIVVFLTLEGLAVQFSQYHPDGPFPTGSMLRLFHLNREGNIPTWYASAALLASSLLLAVIAWVKKEGAAPYTRHWAVLSAIFLYLSLDEGARVHELSNVPLRSALRASGVLYWTWVVPGAIVVATIALAYRRFLLHLPAKTRRFFLLAGALYVGGALGMELLEGWYLDLHGKDLVHAWFIVLEEFLEMLGVVVFIHALLDYLSSSTDEIRLIVRH